MEWREDTKKVEVAATTISGSASASAPDSRLSRPQLKRASKSKLGHEFRDTFLGGRLRDISLLDT